MAEIYSHSKLSTFEQCRLKYKFRYIDKIKPEIEQSIESHLGKMVHNALEWLYTKVKQKELPTLDEVIMYYSKDWQDKFKPNFVIVKKELTPENYFNKGVEFLINYYIKHQPFEDGTLELEKKVFFNLDSEGKYRIIGFIDRLVYNLEKQRYEVHDYKTSAGMPRQEDFDTDRQLALYSIAIKELNGYNEEVILVWHYLAHNKKVESQRTNEQLSQLKQKTIDLINEIQSTTNFPPNKSVLCNWCEYKSMCPVWKD